MSKENTSHNAGTWTRFWNYLTLVWIGIKWNFIELFSPHRKFDLKKIPRRPDEVAVITGGGRGIGIHVVKKLLQLHMHVVIGCRSVSSGEAAVEELRKKGVSTGSTEILQLDLTSLESVRQFATTVSTAYPRINILLNNAGIMASPFKLTKDNFESQFQVNYLSHFLLTNMLLPNLKKAGRQGKASRVVNVSSCAHYGGKVNFEDIDLQKSFSSSMAYMSSKLLQVVSTKYLDHVLKAKGDFVKVYAVHPGVIKTDLYEHVGAAKLCGWLLTLLYKTADQGADGVTFTAISTKFEDEGGLFFCNSSVNSVNRLAKDSQVQTKLWEVSCRLSGWKTSESANEEPKNTSEEQSINTAVIIGETRKLKKKISMMKDEASRPVPKGPIPNIQVLPGTPSSAFKIPTASSSDDKSQITHLVEPEPVVSATSDSESDTITALDDHQSSENNNDSGSDSDSIHSNSLSSSSTESHKSAVSEVSSKLSAQAQVTSEPLQELGPEYSPDEASELSDAKAESVVISVS